MRGISYRPVEFCVTCGSPTLAIQCRHCQRERHDATFVMERNMREMRDRMDDELLKIVEDDIKKSLATLERH